MINARVIEKLCAEFETNLFWEKVFRPAMEASIKEAIEALIHAENIRDIRTLQTGIQMTRKWMTFPGRKKHDVLDDQAFEAARLKEQKPDIEDEVA